MKSDDESERASSELLVHGESEVESDLLLGGDLTVELGGGELKTIT